VLASKEVIGYLVESSGEKTLLHLAAMCELKPFESNLLLHNRSYIFFYRFRLKQCSQVLPGAAAAFRSLWLHVMSQAA